MSKKGVKMSIGDFLNDSQYGGLWADDVTDLPKAPSSSVSASADHSSYQSGTRCNNSTMNKTSSTI